MIFSFYEVRRPNFRNDRICVLNIDYVLQEQKTREISVSELCVGIVFDVHDEKIEVVRQRIWTIMEWKIFPRRYVD